MYIINRYIGQSLMIGEDIEVMVMPDNGDKSVLGVKAPRNLKVTRKEFFTSNTPQVVT
jgi:carbon storage regulator